MQSSKERGSSIILLLECMKLVKQTCPESGEVTLTVRLHIPTRLSREPLHAETLPDPPPSLVSSMQVGTGREDNGTR